MVEKKYDEERKVEERQLLKGAVGSGWQLQLTVGKLELWTTFCSCFCSSVAKEKRTGLLMLN